MPDAGMPEPVVEATPAAELGPKRTCPASGVIQIWPAVTPPKPPPPTANLPRLNFAPCEKIAVSRYADFVGSRLQLVFERDGSIHETCRPGAPYPGPDLSACVLSAIPRGSGPPPKAERLTVFWQLPKQ
jgi:hypothetical protein